jgi:hypothetical protein
MSSRRLWEANLHVRSADLEPEVDKNNYAICRCIFAKYATKSPEISVICLGQGDAIASITAPCQG